MSIPQSNHAIEWGRHAEGGREMSRKGIKLCAEWLAYCLKISWSRDDLDRLEEVWWEYHDEDGNLK